jgi:twitching motility protein PilT
MIRESKVFQIPSTIQTSRKQGMSLMNDAMLDLVRKKVVEPKDAYSKAVDKSGLASMFTANGIEMA